MDIHSPTFFYGTGKMDSGGPLGRFLPPIPDSSLRSFLAEPAAPGAWVLEPFGASPRFVVALARAGRRVLVTVGNPVNRFLLELAAHPPAAADLKAALAELSASRKEGERLETHLQNLYQTECDYCGRALPAEAFLWEGKTGALTAKIYNCIHCGQGGEHPATPADVERAALWARSEGLHRARALSRVTTADDPDRIYAEEALNFYLPRSIYALGTLINRLDNLPTSDERRRCALALLLWALDAGNMLWPHNTERARPRQLSAPTLFREHNLWLALEAALKYWQSDAPPAPMCLWPEEPPESGGICLFEGPLRELAADLGEIPLSGVVGVIPRPNPAFWTLSALWAGWLWGREAAASFKPVLRRRRFDWDWHSQALAALLANIRPGLAENAPVECILPEPEPGLLSATLVAGQSAQMGFEALSLYGEQEPARVAWRVLYKKEKGHLPLDARFVRKVLRLFLRERGAPAPYLGIHAAALSALAAKGMLPGGDGAVAALEQAVFEALAAPDFVDVEKRTTPETGLWGLREWQERGLFGGSV